MKPKILPSMCLLMLIAGCSVEPAVVSNDGFAITDINIKINGAANETRPNMIDVCKGFILSRQQVQDFFVHAIYIKDPQPDDNYDILPCYTSGTAKINSDSYKWIIRSGGIGEFFNKKNKLIKICGKDCCSKVAGIC